MTKKCYQKENVSLLIKIGDLIRGKNTFDDIKTAGQYYKKAINIDPKSIDAQIKIGEIFATLAIDHNLNKIVLLNKAIQHFAEALKLDPSNKALSEKISILQQLL